MRVLNSLVRRQILAFLDLMQGLKLKEVIGLAAVSSSRELISQYIKIPEGIQPTWSKFQVHQGLH